MSVSPMATPLASAASFLPSFRFLGRDLPASLVVFLIAIPLSLGIALASGAPIMAGILAAAVGGIVVGLVAGAPLQVSGPAAGLTAIVFAYTHQLGWPTMCIVTICAGLIQILLGSVRVARVCLMVSPAVVHGMLAGIGITIVLSQLHIIMGGKPESHALLNLKALPAQIFGMHLPSTFLGLLTVAFLLGWQKLAPARVRVIPGSLIAIALVTLVSVVLDAHVARIDLKGGLSAGISLPHLPPASQWMPIATAALTVALVASVESLLSAVATDKLHTGKRADFDRELIGQGLANTISGAIGGLPVTGVIVRSSANVAAGAKTQLSAILHGVWMLAAVALLTPLIQKIPLAALAGLLVYVGIQLVNVHHIKSVITHREAAIYFATVAGVVCLNLLEGVALGIGLAIIFLVRRLATPKIDIEQGLDRYHVRVSGTLTFAAVPRLAQALSRIPQGSHVDVDLAVDFLDHAAFEALHGWRLGQERSGGHVDIDERHEQWYHAAADGKPQAEKANSNGLMEARITRSRNSSLAEMEIAAPTIETESGATTSLLEGIQKFHRTDAPSLRPLLSRLANEKQHPLELFIACSDSRVAPSLFTSSGPGDLFKVRNVGNLVPPCSCHSHGVAESGDAAAVASAIEYALEALNVETIVVCGHSGCGAMQALLAPEKLTDDMPHLKGWLKNGLPSLALLENMPDYGSTRPLADRLSEANVIQQLAHLRTYPQVKRRESEGRLRLVGMFFDIANADVLIYDPVSGVFLPVAESDARYLAESAMPPVAA